MAMLVRLGRIEKQAVSGTTAYENMVLHCNITHQDSVKNCLDCCQH